MSFDIVEIFGNTEEVFNTFSLFETQIRSLHELKKEMDLKTFKAGFKNVSYVVKMGHKRIFVKNLSGVIRFVSNKFVISSESPQEVIYYSCFRKRQENHEYSSIKEFNNDIHESLMEKGLMNSTNLPYYFATRLVNIALTWSIHPDNLEYLQTEDRIKERDLENMVLNLTQDTRYDLIGDRIYIN